MHRGSWDSTCLFPGRVELTYMEEVPCWCIGHIAPWLPGCAGRHQIRFIEDGFLGLDAVVDRVFF